MPVRKQHLALLRPYLVGEQPREDGEWDMFCPLHVDGKRSAGINVESGVWYCHAGCGGGRVSQLLAMREDWVDPAHPGREDGSSVKRTVRRGQRDDSVTEARAQGWHEALLANEAVLDEFMGERGLNLDTIKRFQIGWDSSSAAYTIPVRNEEGGFWNLRRYQLHPQDDRRKIWSVDGMGAPRLYPIQVLKGKPQSIIICEGELDALITQQAGYSAITRTGAAKVWRSDWSSHFKGKLVYLAHDCDHPGQDANRKVGRALQRIAAEVRVLRLPYPITEKHGKDLSDFWQEYTKEDFERMLHDAQLFDGGDAPEELDPSDATVLDSFDARRVGSPMRITVTVKGKREPGYSVPRKVVYSCTRDAGQKCAVCPMNAAGGHDTIEIPTSDPVVLEMMDSTKGQLTEILRMHYGAMKCGLLQLDIRQFQAVEILFARPSVEHVSGNGAGDYKNVKLTSVGRHDTQPNNTVQATGMLVPSPRGQTNEFLVHDISKLETSLDLFELDDRTAKMLRRFQPRRGQRPIAKLAEIARDLSTNVTKIYGRPEMHAMIDLVLHSALSFEFGGQLEQRGWLEGLIIGDTRTGKSEAARRLAAHYRAGEMVSCEAASFAGVIGGLQQYGGGKEWSINWGVVPLNDRRAVILDEISGLSPDEIAAMSDVRSSGVAKLTKIQQEQTHARTRLLWLGNPRNATMSSYTYGVQAIKPLIGNNEDIARFDLAMSVMMGEVPANEINKDHGGGTTRYQTAACQALIRWVWSRTAEQVRWASGAEDAVRRYANQMGQRYVEDPPLVQVANVRVKIARVAVAMAARLFSTDARCESIVVTRAHVRDAVAFIDLLYQMPNFGYAARSREIIRDRKDAWKKVDDIKQYLVSRKGLAKFLRNAGSFKRQDLEEILNVSREEANAIIHTLYEARMIHKDAGYVRIEPVLHQLLKDTTL